MQYLHLLLFQIFHHHCALMVGVCLSSPYYRRPLSVSGRLNKQYIKAASQSGLAGLAQPISPAQIPENVVYVAGYKIIRTRSISSNDGVRPRIRSRKKIDQIRPHRSKTERKYPAHRSDSLNRHPIRGRYVVPI